MVDNPLAKAVGTRITQLLAIKGKQPIDLAIHCGVGEAAVSKWRSGLNLPSILMLSQVADFLDTSMDYLLSGKQIRDLSLDELTIVANYRSLKTNEQVAVKAMLTQLNAGRDVDFESLM